MATKSTKNTNWAEDPHGFSYQSYLEAAKLQIDVIKHAEAYEQKKTHIRCLECGNDNILDTLESHAYQALYEVVCELVNIPNGNRQLSRQSTAVMIALEKTSNKFSDLSRAQLKAMEDLGVAAGDCLSLGDAASSLVGDVSNQIDMLNNTVQKAYQMRQEKLNNLASEVQRWSTLKRQQDEADSSRNSFGTNFLGVFDSSVTRQEQKNYDDACNRVWENEIRQAEYRGKAENFYRLAIQCRNHSALLAIVRHQLQIVSDQFDIEYARVKNVQDAETNLAEGMLGLRNEIVAGDWTSTRDKSLTVVLRLLKKDDEILEMKEKYAKMELEIKTLIKNSLGDNSVERLLNGQSAVFEPELIEYEFGDPDGLDRDRDPYRS